MFCQPYTQLGNDTTSLWTLWAANPHDRARTNGGAYFEESRAVRPKTVADCSSQIVAHTHTQLRTRCAHCMTSGLPHDVHDAHPWSSRYPTLLECPACTLNRELRKVDVNRCPPSACCNQGRADYPLRPSAHEIPSSIAGMRLCVVVACRDELLRRAMGVPTEPYCLIQRAPLALIHCTLCLER
eukprot:3906513-Amphidinium_carterae.2